MHALHVLFRLALLWFHTIVRPFFGLDGSNVRSGADAAQRLIDASKGDFSDAALFLFFQGRVDRLKVRTTIMIKVKGFGLNKVSWAILHKVARSYRWIVEILHFCNLQYSLKIWVLSSCQSCISYFLELWFESWWNMTSVLVCGLRRWAFTQKDKTFPHFSLGLRHHIVHLVHTPSTAISS